MSNSSRGGTLFVRNPYMYRTQLQEHPGSPGEWTFFHKQGYDIPQKTLLCWFVTSSNFLGVQIIDGGENIELGQLFSGKQLKGLPTSTECASLSSMNGKHPYSFVCGQCKGTRNADF
ncbi:hypothetical protein AVEN_182344-1 [Araneus ventricosus]|uniref:Uncharacterized protein n=1 Tax=Araneus ventricosus TaxID=182803 RepID=A0A4Y2TQP0_ARAVE|nr:hypothetical protein AVEN_182344-1 [Araneus ventricosus]